MSELWIRITKQGRIYDPVILILGRIFQRIKRLISVAFPTGVFSFPGIMDMLSYHTTLNFTLLFKNLSVFLYSPKILQYMLHLHPTILSNYYTNYTNTKGTGPQGAKDNDYPVAIKIKTCK